MEKAENISKEEWEQITRNFVEGRTKGFTGKENERIYQVFQEMFNQSPKDILALPLWFINETSGKLIKGKGAGASLRDGDINLGGDALTNLQLGYRGVVVATIVHEAAHAVIHKGTYNPGGKYEKEEWYIAAQELLSVKPSIHGDLLSQDIDIVLGLWSPK